MAKEQLETAREMIKAKKYNEARGLLRTVDHPLASEWLDKIDQLDPPQAGHPLEQQPPMFQSAKGDGGFMADIDSSDVIQADNRGSGGSLPLAIIGGIIGMAIGAAIWAGVAIVTKYEVGWIAIIVGALTGGGVVLLGRQRGIVFQVIAIILAVVGIGAGKYVAYYYVNQAAVVEEYGQEVWDSAGLTLFSSDTIQFFIEDLQALLDPMDILFLVLAVITAWGIPSARAAQRREARQATA